MGLFSANLSKRFSLFIISAFAASSILLATSAAAQSIDSVNADELQSILENAGLNPELSIDSSSGAPVAVAELGDYKFFVRAMNCSGTPKSCSELMFFANFPLGRALSVQDLVAVNNYNESQVFGRAYVLRSSGQNGEVGVDYVIELAGGVSKDHIEENVARWADVVAAFIQTMTGSQTGS